VASMSAHHQGLSGDVVTVNLGREATIREITVEVADTSAAWDLATDLNKLPGVNVLWHHDRAFIRHDGGKLHISARHPVTTVQEMRDIYTPGVARICTAIAENPNLAGRYTMIGQTVAIVTNGSRVLGLGDIGPVAAMPVMEGKAVFYDQCVGLSAMPILLDAHDPDTFVETVMRIAPTFGGAGSSTWTGRRGCRGMRSRHRRTSRSARSSSRHRGCHPRRSRNVLRR